MKRTKTLALVIASFALVGCLVACSGSAGPQGEKGEKGDKGDQGEVGPAGPQGPAGQDGQDGETGPAGPQGPAGNDGQDGQPGQDGQDGQDLTVQPFTVTFDSMGGSEVAPIEMDHIGRITKPADPTREFYLFEGWFTEDNYEWIFSKDIVAEDTTLYAHWAFDSANYTLREAAVLSTIGDSQFTVWTESTWRGHVKGSWNAGCTINMSWRTMAIFDADGVLAYAVWCPANGYGSPAGNAYARDIKYENKDNNPVFVLGAEFPDNGQDFELVIPEGGFAVTSHTDGANTLATMISNGAITEAAAGLNAQAAAAPVAKYFYDADAKKVTGIYAKAYLQLGGTNNDIDATADAQGEYTVKTTLAQWKNMKLFYGTTQLKHANASFVGAVKPEVGGASWDNRLYDEDGSGTFFRGDAGSLTYVVTYNPAQNLVKVAIEDKFCTLATGGYRTVDLTDGVGTFAENFNAWNRLNGATFVKDGKAVHCQYDAFQINSTAAPSLYVANDTDPLYQLLTNAAANITFTVDVINMTLVCVAA